MRQTVFSSALLATARIACCAAIFACDEGDSKDDTALSSTDTALSSIDTALSSIDTASDSLDTGTSDIPSLPDWEECSEEVASDFTAETVDNDTAACCQLIAEHYDTVMETDVEAIVAWDTRSDCCELLEWQGSMACTPWGPPRPPVASGFSREETVRHVEAVRQAALA